jgi:hypothetical protein
VLLRRHGRGEGGTRIVDGTRRNCEAMGVPDRFDEGLTRRWVNEIADALEEHDAATFAEFIGEHPELERSDLLGLPLWRGAG